MDGFMMSPEVANVPSNEALHLTAITLRFIVAGKLLDYCCRMRFR